MKPAEVRLVRALDGPDPAIRLFLLYGSDEAGARAYAARVGAALGAEAERIDLASSALKADPARLADEAAAISLFGGNRWIRLDPATDDAVDAAAALLDAAVAGNPVVAIAPSLRKDSRLVKLAQGHAAALVHACYVPEGRDADALAVELGRGAGLDMRPDVARRLAGASNGDRAILAGEIEKLALYLDAAPGTPKALEHGALDALGAAMDEGNLGRLTSAVFAGDGPSVDAELGQLASDGIEGIFLIRALARRALLLAQLRAQVAEGDSVDRAMETGGKTIFFKERDAVRRALGRWTPGALVTAAARLAETERQVKTSGYAGHAVVEEEILAIVRHAARRR